MKIRPGTRVLIVEDTTDTREIFALLLESEGAEVFTAPTAAVAIEIAAEYPFDVLLTDLGLPDLPGELVIRKIVAQSRRRPKVIVATGYGEPHVGRARAAGADVVLSKPVVWSRLVSEICTPILETVAA